MVRGTWTCAAEPLGGAWSQDRGLISENAIFNYDGSYLRWVLCLDIITASGRGGGRGRAIVINQACRALNPCHISYPFKSNKVMDVKMLIFKLCSATGGAVLPIILFGICWCKVVHKTNIYEHKFSSCLGVKASAQSHVVASASEQHAL